MKVIVTLGIAIYVGEGKCDIYFVNHLLISMLYFVLFYHYQLLPM